MNKLGRFYLMSILTGFLLGLFSFAGQSLGEDLHKHKMSSDKKAMQHKKPDSKSKRMQLSKSMRSLLDNVLKENDSLRQLFFKRETKGYSEQTDSFAKALKEAREKNDIKHASHKNHLNSILTTTEELLTMMKMVSGNDRKNVYGQISDSLSEMVKMFDVNNSYHIFYCPMEKKYWVAKGTKVENPYASEKMPDCGEIKF